MKTSFFTSTAVYFVVLSVICLGLVTWAIAKTVKSNTHLNPRGHWRFLFVISIWITIISGVALSGFFSDFSTFPPRLLMAPLIPIISITVVTLFGKLDNLLIQVPPSWIMYLQTFRLPVEILLWMLFMQNLLPAQMTFEGRNWDILVGLTAIPAGLVCFGQHRFKTSFAIAWNIGGLLLLLNIVTVAVLSMPTPFRVFMNDPANEIVATFPFVLLPGILVPLAFSLHVLSLRQVFLLKKEGAASRLQNHLAKG
ncbi:MAG: hypothetical protein ACMVP2_27945 [Imperialibacter sp.]|uniref:hypothetical protein n=1 Tax=Imperialibacter sp. TaxID=2038411 RepID=UPI003A84E3DA